METLRDKITLMTSLSKGMKEEYQHQKELMVPIHIDLTSFSCKYLGHRVEILS